MLKDLSPERLPIRNHVLCECLAGDLDVELASIQIRIHQVTARQMILRECVQISPRQRRQDNARSVRKKKKSALGQKNCMRQKHGMI
jgi:hypothetical protein